MAVLTALTLITLDFRGDGGGVLGSARNTVLDALGPVRSAFSWVFTPVGNAWNGITNYDDLEAENEQLRSELDQLKGDTLQVAELQRKTRELQLLLDLRDTDELLPRVAARVIDAPLTNFEQTLEIDRGATSGIRVGMPVESGSGLVGRISQVGRTRSRVQLLTDTGFAAGVRLVRSGDAGVAHGNGSGRELTVDFIDLETVVIPGESVVTSGLEGSVFPEGLLVGTVVDSRPLPVLERQEVTVAPAADLERLSFVQVILYRPPPVDNRPVELPPETSGPTVPGPDEGGEPSGTVPETGSSTTTPTAGTSPTTSTGPESSTTGPPTTSGPVPTSEPTTSSPEASTTTEPTTSSPEASATSEAAAAASSASAWGKLWGVSSIGTKSETTVRRALEPPTWAGPVGEAS